MMDTLNKNEFQTAGRGAEQDFWSWRFAGKMLGLPRKYNLQVHQLCVAAQIAHHHHHSEWGRLINAPDQVVIISVASSVEGQLQSIIKCASFILGFHGTLPRKRGFASACAHKLAYCMRAVGLGIIAHFLLQHRNHRTVQDSNSLPRMYNLQVHQLCVTAQTAHHHSEWARIFVSVAPAVESQV